MRLPEKRRLPIFFLADQTMDSSSTEYKLLPSSYADVRDPPHSNNGSRPPSRWPRISLSWVVSRRRIRIVLAILLSLVSIALLHRFAREFYDSKYPPLYEKYHEQELHLPQNNPDLLPPEGRHGKYLWVSSHLDGK